MNPRTVLTTASGRNVDLLNPSASDIRFADIAEHLAKENRYNGATPSVCYSVAEHSVRCADAAIATTGDQLLGAYLLLHDCHEAYLKDDTTPKKRALGEIAARNFGVLAKEIEEAFGLLTEGMDVAIRAAAGISFPPSPDLQQQIHHWDRVLLATEWRDLMMCEPPYNFDKDLLDAKICPMEWQFARNEFYSRCRTLLPSFRESQ
jgi:hypothetical protein